MCKKLLIILIFATLNLNSCKYVGPNEGVPSQIRAMYKHDPSQSVVLGWKHYSKSRGADTVAYGTLDLGTEFDQYPNQIEMEHKTNYLGVRSAFVELKNLIPDTRYYFVIKNSFGLSKRYFVHTLPDDRNSRISIIAGGDSRNNRVPRKAANLLVSKLKPHFVYFGGDMTSMGFGNEWNTWFNDWELTTGDDGRVTPIITARGNHERKNYILTRLFWLPKSNYYALSIADGLIRAYVLNSESAIGGDQTDWLVDDLKAHQDSDWRIAIYHRPIRPHVEKKKEGTNMYRHWAPAFYKYRMNLAVESDAHTVKSTYAIRPSVEVGSEEGFIRDDKAGTVFVGEGCWGAPLRADDDIKSWTRESDSFNSFKWIFIDRQSIEVRTVKVDNAEKVDSLPADNRFGIPDGIDIWDSGNGDVHSIYR